jgi:dUTP pyrophosphatase
MSSSNPYPIYFQSLNEKSTIPFKTDKGSSGFDLFSQEDKILFPKETYLFRLGFSMEFPSSLEAQIRSRSGLSLKHGIIVLNSPGTVDSSYRGEVGVILHNLSEKKYEVQEGDRIAQMVFLELPSVKWELREELSHSSRGEEGFGSTGR